MAWEHSGTEDNVAANTTKHMFTKLRVSPDMTFCLDNVHQVSSKRTGDLQELLTTTYTGTFKAPVREDVRSLIFTCSTKRIKGSVEAESEHSVFIEFQGVL